MRSHLWFRGLSDEDGEGGGGAWMSRFKESIRKWEPSGNVSEVLEMEWQREIWNASHDLRMTVERRRQADKEEAERGASGENRDLESFGGLGRRLGEPLGIAIKGERGGQKRGEGGVGGGVVAGWKAGFELGGQGAEREKGKMSERARMVARERAALGDLVAAAAREEEDVAWGKGLDTGTKDGEDDGGDLEDNFIEIAPDGDDELAKKLRLKRRVWDKQKRKYVNEEDLNSFQSRELKIKRNEAGERIRVQSKNREAVAHGGGAYKRWASSSGLRVQGEGEVESAKIVGKAAGKAVVPLRSGGGQPGEGRSGASLVVGPKKAAPSVSNSSPLSYLPLAALRPPPSSLLPPPSSLPIIFSPWFAEFFFINLASRAHSHREQHSLDIFGTL